jgi:hypothetical protein
MPLVLPIATESDLGFAGVNAVLIVIVKHLTWNINPIDLKEGKDMVEPGEVV